MVSAAGGASERATGTRRAWPATPTASRRAVGVQHLAQRLEQAQAVQLAERALGRARPEDLVVLLRQARGRGQRNPLALARDRVDNGRVDREAETRGERHRPLHPHRVLAEADIGIADDRTTPRAQILEAADVVDDGERGDVVEERVQREIAPEGVLLGRAERVVAMDQVVVLAVAPGVSAGRRRRPRPPPALPRP